jgi:hypothetical protein
MQREVDLAERHNNDPEDALVNATTSVTPEAEHLPTGARCRFWYGMADISFEFYNGRFLSCRTSLDWVSTGAAIFHREERQLSDSHYLAYARDPAADPRKIALHQAARTEADAPGETRSEVSPLQHWATAAGHRIPYATASITYPAGAPGGTERRGYRRLYVGEVGEWILAYSANGPIHYREALDGYAETGFRQLLESVAQAGRILPRVASPPPAAAAEVDLSCQDSRLLAAAAAEAEPFRSLLQRQFRPQLAGGYCTANSAGGYTCIRRSVRGSETAEAVAQRLRRCLPGATISAVTSELRDEWVITAGSLEARVLEHGSPRSRGGRSIIVYIASRPVTD